MSRAPKIAVGDIVTYNPLDGREKIRGRVAQVAQHGQAVLVESYEPFRAEWVSTDRVKKARS